MEKNKNNSESSPTPKQKEAKKADLDLLQISFSCGFIRLKYLGGAGLCLWIPASYTYIKVDNKSKLYRVKSE